MSDSEKKTPLKVLREFQKKEGILDEKIAIEILLQKSEYTEEQKQFWLKRLSQIIKGKALKILKEYRLRTGLPETYAIAALVQKSEYTDEEKKIWLKRLEQIFKEESCPRGWNQGNGRLGKIKK